MLGDGIFWLNVGWCNLSRNAARCRMRKFVGRNKQKQSASVVCVCVVGQPLSFAIRHKTPPLQHKLSRESDPLKPVPLVPVPPDEFGIQETDASSQQLSQTQKKPTPTTPTRSLGPGLAARRSTEIQQPATSSQGSEGLCRQSAAGLLASAQLSARNQTDEQNSADILF